MKLNFVLLCAMAQGVTAPAQSSGTFTATGSMTTPRVWHTATLLYNGKVLMAGGQAGFSAAPLARAELYDPSNGTFSLTGSMTIPRAQHTATVLPEGRVLIAGGLRSVTGLAELNLLVSTEVYDPATGIFTATGDMAIGRSLHTATLLNNGKVLIGGARPSLLFVPARSSTILG